MTEPSPAELARARHRLAALLGQLCADGLVARDVVAAIPPLAPLCDVPPDLLAAEHHRWFVYELSPHESAFFDGQLDGPSTAAVRATWSAIGFAPGRWDLADDHVGIELAALAHLFAAELEALEDGHDPAPIRLLQRRVADHLLGWLPLLAGAVEGPWADTVGLALDLVTSIADPPPSPTLSFERDDLLIPRRCGWVCTWTALRHVSEAVDVPIGFGSKRRALDALLDDALGGPALMNVVRRGSARRYTESDTP